MRLFIFILILAAIIALQIFLSKRENKWLGLILPTISFLFALLVVPLNMMTPFDGVNMEFMLKMLIAFLIYNIPTIVFGTIYFVCRINQENKKSLAIGTILVFIGLCFIIFAVNHPEASFPWSIRITYMLYGIYLWLLFRLLFDIPRFKRIRKAPEKDCLLRSCIYFVLAIGFFLMEITAETIDIYTILRGFIVSGSVDFCVENIRTYYRLKKSKV